jgi:hypothetical protein
LGAYVDFPQIGETGIAEIGGLNFIVSLGNFINDKGGKPNRFIIGGTFMHELGHTLGLHHGGGFGLEAPCPFPCEDGPNFKPNYLSVMNYRYQTTGVLVGKAVGSSEFDPNDFGQRRLDYSRQTLPRGGNTPGALSENGQLDENAGLGSGNADLFDFDDGICGFQIAASDGPVDWDGDGLATNMNATADLNPEDHPANACENHYQTLRGHDDWSEVLAHLQGNHLTGLVATAPTHGRPEPELSADVAERFHTLYPIRQVAVAITRVKGEDSFTMTLLGGPDLDVTEVDMLSLRFHGAGPSRIGLLDSNGDGYPDLLVEFPVNRINLHRDATKARLTGWLLNSQRFVGEADLERKRGQRAPTSGRPPGS